MKRTMSRVLGAALAATFVLTLGLSSASADSFKFEKGRVSVDFPASFDIELYEDPQYGDIVVFGNEDVLGSMVSVPAAELEVAVGELINVLLTYATDVEQTTDIIEIDVNGIPGYTAGGTGKLATDTGTIDIEWFGVILMASPDEPVIMATIVDTTKWATVEPEITALVNSITAF